MEAVNRGTAAVGVRGDHAVVIAVEKRTVGKLQDQRSTSKIALLDDHVTVAFAGVLLVRVGGGVLVLVLVALVFLGHAVETHHIISLPMSSYMAQGLRPMRGC
jgi:hypothetical protein